MNKKNKTRASIAAAGLAAAAMVSGCSRSDEDWANAPGTNGHVNLDAVKEAFQKSQEIAKFEQRVNEIHEGDKLVIFRAEKVSGGFEYTAIEDLNGDKKPGRGDDKLFTLLVANGTATLNGTGVNSYYKQSWPYDPAKVAAPTSTTKSSHSRRHHSHFYHWYGYRRYGWGGGYYTSAPRFASMSKHRDSYRSGAAFQSQVKANAQFEQKMSQRYGSSFRKSATKVSPARKSYISKSLSSGSYKSGRSTSGWGVRSSQGVKSASAASRGVARGYGGGRGASGFGV